LFVSYLKYLNYTRDSTSIPSLTGEKVSRTISLRLTSWKTKIKIQAINLIYCETKCHNSSDGHQLLKK